jgi:hypothetical protein
VTYLSNVYHGNSLDGQLVRCPEKGRGRALIHWLGASVSREGELVGGMSGA